MKSFSEIFVSKVYKIAQFLGKIATVDHVQGMQCLPPSHLQDLSQTYENNKGQYKPHLKYVQ